jgi:Flp pilus assembly protein TadB
MTELDYEDAPAFEPRVPRVRNWLGPALRDWKRGCYPPRRGFFLVWGFLLPLWAIAAAFKFFIYAAGIAVMLVAYVPWVIAELITYRHRCKRVRQRLWTRYMLALHEEDPPTQAA